MPPNILSFVVLSCKMHVSYVSVVVWLWLRLVCACDCIKHAKTTARLCSVYGELSPTEPVECLYAQIVNAATTTPMAAQLPDNHFGKYRHRHVA